jgi:hypothetical protein
LRGDDRRPIGEIPARFTSARDIDGAFLMIHGDCLSRGCYAMTDEQIGEIYSLACDSLLGSQQSFQIQAYPFRMTPENLARHRTNPNMAFWKMLKVGNDHFEATHLEPKVEVCNRRYVFDAHPPANSSKPLVFDPTGACPTFVISPKIARSVRQKEHVDEAQYKQLVKANVPVALIHSGLDGGMNRVFLAQIGGNMPPADRSPQPAPVSSTDNGSFASKLFGALFGSKPAPQTQVSSSDSATRDRSADSVTTSITGPKAKPAAQVESVAAAETRSSNARNNDSAKNGARENDTPKSKSQLAAAVQPTPTFEQEADAQPLASDHDTLNAPSTRPADSFVSRWGGLQ